MLLTQTQQTLSMPGSISTALGRKAPLTAFALVIGSPFAYPSHRPRRCWARSTMSINTVPPAKKSSEPSATLFHGSSIPILTSLLQRLTSVPFAACEVRASSNPGPIMMPEPLLSPYPTLLCLQAAGPPSPPHVSKICTIPPPMCPPRPTSTSWALPVIWESSRTRQIYRYAPSSRNNVWILMCPSYLIRHSSRNSAQTLSALHILLCLSTEEVMISHILV